jgi:hypothetical protein
LEQQISQADDGVNKADLQDEVRESVRPFIRTRELYFGPNPEHSKIVPLSDSEARNWLSENSPFETR